MPEPTLARYPGTCPLCGKFIAKNRSQVLPLPEPRSLGEFAYRDCKCLGAHSETCHSTAAPQYICAPGGRVYRIDEISSHQRTWAHAACVREATP